MNQTNEAGNLLPTMHNFNGAEVRTITINNEHYFIAKDVCDVLEISNHIEALSKLDEDEKGGYVIPTQFGDKLTNCVNESGLYHLIFKSRKPQAKAFRKWVTAEVLPAIRKTGSYSVGEMSGVSKELIGLGEGMIELYKKYKILPCYSLTDFYWVLKMEEKSASIPAMFEMLNDVGLLYDLSSSFYNQPTPFAIDTKMLLIKEFPYQKGKNRSCHSLSLPVFTYSGLRTLLNEWLKVHKKRTHQATQIQ